MHWKVEMSFLWVSEYVLLFYSVNRTAASRNLVLYFTFRVMPSPVSSWHHATMHKVCMCYQKQWCHGSEVDAVSPPAIEHINPVLEVYTWWWGGGGGSRFFAELILVWFSFRVHAIPLASLFLLQSVNISVLTSGIFLVKNNLKWSFPPPCCCVSLPLGVT